MATVEAGKIFEPGIFTPLVMISMAVAKQSRQKQGLAAAVPARKERQARLQGRDLRRALEELRDTKSETRTEELKKAIGDSICGA